MSQPIYPASGKFFRDVSSMLTKVEQGNSLLVRNRDGGFSLEPPNPGFVTSVSQFFDSACYDIPKNLACVDQLAVDKVKQAETAPAPDPELAQELLAIYKIEQQVARRLRKPLVKDDYRYNTTLFDRKCLYHAARLAQRCRVLLACEQQDYCVAAYFLIQNLNIDLTPLRDSQHIHKLLEIAPANFREPFRSQVACTLLLALTNMDTLKLDKPLWLDKAFSHSEKAVIHLMHVFRNVELDVSHFMRNAAIYKYFDVLREVFQRGVSPDDAFKLESFLNPGSLAMAKLLVEFKITATEEQLRRLAELEEDQTRGPILREAFTHKCDEVLMIGHKRVLIPLNALSRYIPALRKSVRFDEANPAAFMDLLAMLRDEYRVEVEQDKGRVLALLRELERFELPKRLAERVAIKSLALLEKLIDEKLSQPDLVALKDAFSQGKLKARFQKLVFRFYCGAVSGEQGLSRRIALLRAFKKDGLSLGSFSCPNQEVSRLYLTHEDPEQFREELLTFYDLLYELTSDSQWGVRTALVHRHTGHIDRAIDILEQLFRSNETDMALRCTYITFLLEKGNIGQAHELIQTAPKPLSEVQEGWLAVCRAYLFKKEDNHAAAKAIYDKHRKSFNCPWYTREGSIPGNLVQWLYFGQEYHYSRLRKETFELIKRVVIERKTLSEDEYSCLSDTDQKFLTSLPFYPHLFKAALAAYHTHQAKPL